MSYGYTVVSVEISKITLNVAKKNNKFDFTFPKFFVPYPYSDVFCILKNMMLQ